MSWSSKVLIREAFTESDVQLYQEVALGFILHPLQESVAAESDRPEGVVAVPPEALVAVAQQRAAEVIAAAQQQAETLEHEARAQGLARGQEEGKEAAKQELLPALVTCAQMGQSLIVLEEQLIARFTPQLVGLALEIAEKVIGKQVEADPQLVASVLERARAELPQARFVRICLHPLDHSLLAELRPDLVLMGEQGGRTVEMAAAEEIARGGCRVETEMGVVDATIPTQMQEIRRQMLDEEEL
jgi:flagellar biosynthesis/type III secretory pathway protein FliH